MMVKPAITNLLKIVPDRYSLVIMASKRARQIAVGAQTLTNSKEKSPVTLATIEIEEGKVKKINDENEE